MRFEIVAECRGLPRVFQADEVVASGKRRAYKTFNTGAIGQLEQEG